MEKFLVQSEFSLAIVTVYYLYNACLVESFYTVLPDFKLCPKIYITQHIK